MGCDSHSTNLVENEVFPLFASEGDMILYDKLVTGDAKVKCIRLRPADTFKFALLLRAVVGEDLEPRTPLLQLHLPVEHDTGGHHNQVRPPHTCSEQRSKPLAKSSY